MIEVKPWDELLSSLSKSLRSTVRRAVRRAAADGLHRKIADPSDTKNAARRLVALQERLGRNIVSDQSTDKQIRGFYSSCCRPVGSSGVGKDI